MTDFKFQTKQFPISNFFTLKMAEKKKSICFLSIQKAIENGSWIFQANLAIWNRTSQWLSALSSLCTAHTHKHILQFVCNKANDSVKNKHNMDFVMWKLFATFEPWENPQHFTLLERETIECSMCIFSIINSNFVCVYFVRELNIEFPSFWQPIDWLLPEPNLNFLHKIQDTQTKTSYIIIYRYLNWL